MCVCAAYGREAGSWRTVVNDSRHLDRCLWGTKGKQNERFTIHTIVRKIHELEMRPCQPNDTTKDAFSSLGRDGNSSRTTKISFYWFRLFGTETAMAMAMGFACGPIRRKRITIIMAAIFFYRFIISAFFFFFRTSKTPRPAFRIICVSYKCDRFACNIRQHWERGRGSGAIRHPEICMNMQKMQRVVKMRWCHIICTCGRRAAALCVPMNKCIDLEDGERGYRRR